MKRTMFVLLATLLVLPLFLQPTLAAPAGQQGNCRFFTETVEGDAGYFVCDDENARFLSAFETWGLQKIGYPISQRYTRDGFVTQAFQKAIMQWRADTGSVNLVNIFDDLHNDGFDERLLQTRQVPNQLPPGWDGDASFAEVVQKRQALLEKRPALHAAYFASSNPLTFYGLPTSEVQDMGNHYAARTQRTVLQEWKEDVPWAKAGQVTIANGGDIAKELGGLPSNALIGQTMGSGSSAAAPQPAPSAPTPSEPAPSAPSAPSSAASGTILFTSNRSSFDDCYSMNADGSNVRQLTTFGFCYDAHFTPDGSQIVFTHSEGGEGRLDLWIMGADGSNPRNLTNTPHHEETFGVVSPDGQKIAYLFGWPGGFEIYTMNLDGSDRKPITSREFDWMPAWSPNGQQIAFSSARDGSFNIWVVNQDGTGLRKVTHFDQNRVAISPVFSPDGQKIAFSTISRDTPWEIWTVNLDGSNAQRLTGTVGNEQLHSPTIAGWHGDQFVIGGYEGNWDPYIINAATGAVQRLEVSNGDDKPSDWLP